jgi:hypothetical protein
MAVKVEVELQHVHRVLAAESDKSERAWSENGLSADLATPYLVFTWCVYVRHRRRLEDVPRAADVDDFEAEPEAMTPQATEPGAERAQVRPTVGPPRREQLVIVHDLTEPLYEWAGETFLRTGQRHPAT